jgi:hypothetical protein
MRRILAMIRAVARGPILEMASETEGTELYCQPMALEPALGAFTLEGRAYSDRARRRMMRIIRCIDD